VEDIKASSKIGYKSDISIPWVLETRPVRFPDVSTT
jgi:hypothetical protein